MKRMNLAAAALLLAFGLVAPIWTAESSSPATFSLHLEEILATQGLVGFAAAPEVEPSASKVVALPTLQLAVDVAKLAGNAAAFNSSVEAAEAAAQESSTPQRRGFGRWMKKYWYIPVIVAGVILAEPFDDDKNDDED